MNKKYTAVIKGKDTDEDTLRDILGDEFELIELESEDTEDDEEDALIQARKDIWTYLSKYTKLTDVEAALGKRLNREACNTVLKEIKDSMECLSDYVEGFELTPTRTDGPGCKQCGKSNPPMTHDGNKFCDLGCVHKYIHS